jgi:transposase
VGYTWRVGLKTGWMSSVDTSCEQLYKMYKSRDNIEKMFDTYKTVLEADKLCLQDTMSVHSHVFISFLCLYTYKEIGQLLKKAGLDNQYTPMDMLKEYSKVLHATTPKRQHHNRDHKNRRYPRQKNKTQLIP